MEKEKRVEDNFADMLAMLKKKVQEKDEEIKRLQEENALLREKYLKGKELIDETIRRR